MQMSGLVVVLLLLFLLLCSRQGKECPTRQERAGKKRQERLTSAPFGFGDAFFLRSFPQTPASPVTARVLAEASPQWAFVVATMGLPPKPPYGPRTM